MDTRFIMSEEKEPENFVHVNLTSPNAPVYSNIDTRTVAAPSIIYEGIGHIVHISTDIGRSCEHCSESIGVERFAKSINHYIEAHGYKLLHVGAQTTRNDEGHIWHTTIAVVGK